MRKMIARFGVGVLVVVGVLVCGLTLLYALPHVRAGVVPSGQESASPAPAPSTPPSDAHSQSFDGIITDTHCGAKHSAAVGLSAGDCTRTCVHSGEHFALVDGDKTYALEGDEAILKKVAGERVKIVGTLTDKTIAVTSVTASPTS
jgi:hypothetical protein